MRDAFVDVTMVTGGDLATLRDPAQWLLEKMRDSADALCAESHARLRTDRPPEITVSQAIEPTTGAPLVLVASRWAVVAPDTVVPTH